MMRITIQENSDSIDMTLEGQVAGSLVAQLSRKGIKRVTGWVIGDAGLFDGLRCPCHHQPCNGIDNNGIS